MRNVLTLIICTLTLVVIFAFNFNVAPGLSIKNLFIYLAALMLVMQFILGQRPKAELGSLHFFFWVLIGYAIISSIVAASLELYRGYSFVPNMLVLKGVMFDWWVLFCVFFYGTRSVAEVERLIKLLLIAVSVANAATLAQLAGLINLGREVLGGDGGEGIRVAGVFGHSSDTGALIAFLVPAYIAAAESVTGRRRWFWIGALTCSVAMLALVASRAAFVGLLIGGVWGWALCGRYLSTSKAVKWSVTIATALVPILIVLGIKYWDQIVVRFTSQSSGDASTVTSGRNDIWGAILKTMIEHPLSMLTGYGWNSYSLMDFDYVAHNQYLTFWFELGVIGVLAFTFIFVRAVMALRSAIAIARPDTRRFLLAGLFSILILCITQFFGTLLISWFFIWPYMGLSMRLAMLARAEPKEVTPKVSARRTRIAAGARERPVIQSSKR